MMKQQFAAALVLALACTAVAAGIGVFGKIANQWAAWGGDAYMNALDEKSVAVGQTQVVLSDGICPEVTLTLAQSYYDGEHWYILRDFANRQENIVTFTVQRNTEESADVLTAERTFEDYKVEAEVVVSELKIRTTITVTNFAGAEVMPDEPKPGELCDYRVYVNGERASMLSGEFGAMANGQIEMTFEFALPGETLQTISLVPQYAGENGEWVERAEETVVFEIAK